MKCSSRFTLLAPLFLLASLLSPSQSAATRTAATPEGREKQIVVEMRQLVSTSTAGWAIVRDAERYQSLERELRHVRYIIYTPAGAINYVFGPYASQAHRVASCESGHYIWARNGQYLGMFQMGSYARARYGHGNTPLAQARAAYHYFVASGRDWSPWSCKP